jgi:hypothetical protein
LNWSTKPFSSLAQPSQPSEATEPFFAAKLSLLRVGLGRIIEKRNQSGGLYGQNVVVTSHGFGRHFVQTPGTKLEQSVGKWVEMVGNRIKHTEILQASAGSCR